MGEPGFVSRKVPGASGRPRDIRRFVRSGRSPISCRLRTFNSAREPPPHKGPVKILTDSLSFRAPHIPSVFQTGLDLEAVAGGVSAGERIQHRQE